MKIIDTHIHLGDIYGSSLNFNLEERNPETAFHDKPNLYELMGYRNIYFGRLNYLFKPLIANSARNLIKYGRVPNLLDSMKKNSIERSVILPVEPYVSTDSILAVCKNNPQLIPFCSVHPYDKEKKEKLNRYVKAGCKGLKLHPVIQGVLPDDPAILELLEEIKLYNIPVLFHVGWGAIGKGGCGLIKNYLRILTDFPTVTFIFAHMGFYDPFYFIELAKNHDNIFCDTSWQPANVILNAIDKLGENRIMLGSDWPFNLQSTSLNIILKITQEKPALRDKILYKNFEKSILNSSALL